MDHLRAIFTALSRSAEVIQITKKEIEVQGSSVASTIRHSFNQLQLILDKRKEELLQETAKKVEEKICKLSVQEENLSLAITEVQGIVDYTERFISQSSDNKVMYLHTQIGERIERGMDEHGKSERNSELVEEANIGLEFRCEEALQQICRTKANIVELVIDPAQCTVRGEGAHIAQVNRREELVLSTKLTNSELTRCRAMVVGELKSLYDGSVVKCEVDQSGPGKYCIRYTPTVRGRHELAISIDDQQIANSPFSVSVSISPTLLGEPVKLWTEISSPAGITVNSVNEILVCTNSGILMKLEEKGKLKKLLDNPLYQWQDLATDAEDNIYCVSLSANILRYDKQTNTHQIKEIKQAMSGPGHYGVAVAGEEVMVSEFSNKGTVVVYDRNLEFMRRIQLEDIKLYVGIALDQQNYLYIADYIESAIRVFSHNGELLRSFDGGKRLNNLNGLCVCGSYVYVTNYGNDDVVIFTTSGDYVTSFGQSGDREGDFQGPISICVSKDYFVFVSDHRNNRIQCF